MAAENTIGCWAGEHIVGWGNQVVEHIAGRGSILLSGVARRGSI